MKFIENNKNKINVYIAKMILNMKIFLILMS